MQPAPHSSHFVLAAGLKRGMCGTREMSPAAASALAVSALTLHAATDTHTFTRPLSGAIQLCQAVASIECKAQLTGAQADSLKLSGNCCQVWADRFKQGAANGPH